MSRQTGYKAHLNDPRELAADVLVASVYTPATLPRNCSRASGIERIPNADENVKSPSAAKAVVGTARRYGLDFESLPERKRLQYQAGLIHFTRLRQALLEEYGY